MLSQLISVSFLLLSISFFTWQPENSCKCKLEPFGSPAKTLKCFPLIVSLDCKLFTLQTRCLLSTPWTQKLYRSLHLLREVLSPRPPHHFFIQVFVLLLFLSIWCLWPPYIAQYPPLSVASLCCALFPHSVCHSQKLFLILPISFPLCLSYSRYWINTVCERMSWLSGLAWITSSL